jgi:hypothetical protein
VRKSITITLIACGLVLTGCGDATVTQQPTATHRPTATAAPSQQAATAAQRRAEARCVDAPQKGQALDRIRGEA